MNAAARFLVGLAVAAWLGGVPAQANCVRFPATELPRMGGVRGAWLTDDRFVLIDYKRPRLLVYSVDRGFEGSVSDVVVEPDVAEDLEPWRGGLVLAESTHEVQRLRQLNVVDLQPVTVLWQVAWNGREVPGNEGDRRDIVDLFEVVSLRDRLYFLGRKPEGVIVELAPETGPGSTVEFRTSAEWAALPGELRFWLMPGVRVLAATSGDAAAAFALRFGDSVHIQRISGRPGQLSAFPKLAASLPVFPPAGWENLQRYHTMLEAASYPAGIHGQGEYLHVLMKTFDDGEAVWDLHRIDPVADAVVDASRLPTAATYVSLLPGPKYWLLEESSSHFDDFFRKPTGLLLLDAESLRSGEAISCD